MSSFGKFNSRMKTCTNFQRDINSTLTREDDTLREPSFEISMNHTQKFNGSQGEIAK